MSGIYQKISTVGQQGDEGKIVLDLVLCEKNFDLMMGETGSHNGVPNHSSKLIGDRTFIFLKKVSVVIYQNSKWSPNRVQKVSKHKK